MPQLPNVHIAVDGEGTTTRPTLPCAVLQDPQLLLARNGGKPPLTMQSFTKLVDAGG